MDERQNENIDGDKVEDGNDNENKDEDKDCNIISCPKSVTTTTTTNTNTNTTTTTTTTKFYQNIFRTAPLRSEEKPRKQVGGVQEPCVHCIASAVFCTETTTKTCLVVSDEA